VLIFEGTSERNRGQEEESMTVEEYKLYGRGQVGTRICAESAKPGDQSRTVITRNRLILRLISLRPKRKCRKGETKGKTKRQEEKGSKDRTSVRADHRKRAAAVPRVGAN